MRFYDVMLFVFILNLTLSLFTGMHLFGGVGPEAISGENTLTRSDVEEQVDETRSIGQQEGILGDLNWLVQNVRLVISGVSMFMKAFIDAVTVKPMLNSIMCSPVKCEAGGPIDQLAWMITGIVQLIYFGGIVQLITGRSFKEMQ